MHFCKSVDEVSQDSRQDQDDGTLYAVSCRVNADIQANFTPLLHRKQMSPRNQERVGFALSSKTALMHSKSAFFFSSTARTGSHPDRVHSRSSHGWVAAQEKDKVFPRGRASQHFTAIWGTRGVCTAAGRNSSRS